MNNQVLLITGAGSGLGQLTAQKALDEGWKVAALDINQAGLDKLGESTSLLKIVVDITDYEAVESAIRQCEETLGTITRLTNAAGIMPLGLVMDQSPQLIMQIMAINYGGLVNLSQAALPGMLARGHGEFVSYASMAGHWPTLYMGAYNASKHAVVAYTEVLYHETRGSGVRIVCVCPPIVATPLLKQAKDSVWPKLFDQFPALEPDVVINAVETTLARKQGLWVFPRLITRVSWLLRRWCPSLLWKAVHFIEKR